MKKFLLILFIAISPIFLCAFVKKDFDEMIGFKIKPMEMYSNTEEYIADLRKVFNKIYTIAITAEDVKFTKDLRLENKVIKPHEAKYLGFPSFKYFNKLNYTLYKDGDKKRIEFISQATPNGQNKIESHCVYHKDNSYHIYDSYYTIDEKAHAKGVSPYCSNYLKAFDYLYEKTFFDMYESSGGSVNLKTGGIINKNGFNCRLISISSSSYVLGDDVYDVKGNACLSEQYGFFVDAELIYTSRNLIQTVMKHTVTAINF